MNNKQSQVNRGTFGLSLVTRYRAQLPSFWEDDCWDLAAWLCPGERRERRETLNFAGLSGPIQDELKFVCWRKFSSGEWLLGKPPGPSEHVRRFIWYLEETAPKVNSLLERSLPEWELSVRTYFVEKGKWRGRKQEYIPAFGAPRETSRNDPVMYALRLILDKLNEAYDEQAGISEVDKDVWDIRRLGYATSPGTNKYTLNFTDLRPPWLKRAAMSFCRYWLTQQTLGDCDNKLKAIRNFGRFLMRAHPSATAADAGRELLLEYRSSLTASGLAPGTIKGLVSNLRVFCQTCTHEGLADFPYEFKLYNEDLPPVPRKEPRYLQEEVLRQLESNLDGLPTHYARILAIPLEVGLRISEVLTLPTDCLRENGAGEWTLYYYQHKVKRDHQAPISDALAAIIQQQIVDVREKFGPDERLLFPSTGKGYRSKGKPYNENAVVDALNRLCHERDIKDSSGRRAHITTHQFRHTVAAGLINRGVTIPVIQKLLGIVDAETAGIYARIHERTLKEEWLKYIRNSVDISGNVVNDIPTDVDMAWMRHNVLSQTLPNGRCGLPPTDKCPHSNACLTCVSFRTDKSFVPIHLKQLGETRELLAAARAQGLKRQVDQNEQLETNLANIISALEKQEENTVEDVA